MALPAFARRRCCSNGSLSAARRAHSSKPVAAGGRTLYGYMDRAAHTGSANNGRYSLMLRQRTETGRGWMQAWGVGSSLSVSADQYKQSDSSISNNALSLASHAMSTATSWCDSCLAIYLDSWHRTNTPAAAVYSTTDRLWQYFWLWLAKWRLILFKLWPLDLAESSLRCWHIGH